MKKIIIIIGLIGLFLQVNAQTKLDFYGKWEYTTIDGFEEMDSLSQDMMTSYFSGTTYFLQEDGKFRVTSPMKNYEGDWTYDKEEKKLNFLSYNGSGEIVNANLVDNQNLILAIKNMKMHFKKVSSVDEPKVKDVKLEDDLISIDEKKISKKWYRLYSTKPNQSEFQKELSMVTLKDNYYLFDITGKGSYKVFGTADDFEWSFNEEKNTIYLQFEEQLIFWHIVKCTKKELVLLKGNTGEKWFLSTKEPKID